MKGGFKLITTVADLLNSLMIKEKELLKKYSIIKHGPTIGDMYEGLTTNLLNKAIFEGLDIRVVSGKIRNEEESFSNEIDCMIVEGEGEAIPYTGKFIYNLSQVIAVLEVKKNLYQEDLVDAYNKMKQIYSITEPSNELLNMKAFRDAFRHTVQKELPDYEEVIKLPLHEQMIYHSLLMEEMMPVRIVFGYYGYASEYALRQAFNKYLEKNSGISGFSPTIFPDLIICNNSVLAKLDAMPYISPLDREGNWNFYGSTTHNPFLILLEFVWTKLSYRYNLSNDIFGEDLNFEAFHPFLRAKAKIINNKIGWETNSIYIPKDGLNHEPLFWEWKPAELDEVEWFIITWLCSHQELNTEELEFQQWLSKKGVKLEDVIKSLSEKRLTTFERNKFYLLTDECAVVTVNGKWYAAENKSGRLTNWVKKIMQARYE
ncbi:DUF6602 domain-containing protein [Paenibacillus cucumis (ex Kampfer et al. 2016)]|uniref:DUF6602 domain-containing protein n=1 Tax=Paenibacillus cucumis (ex Kampfer et al. 2016) TaxID=1776858 RepID=A0ABS7KK91_9BACL|nr:DUF6602 domain-containing protein [Paenibacillus cucumis (ex Kampfer et al. 2016)]MBY0204568.1 hypothetical protein [Paenibacillus cucumis (ex Kampfer et al. 2016)]